MKKEYTKKDLPKLVDALWKLKAARTKLDEKIKAFEKPFKDFMDDGDSINGEKFVANMKVTNRTICKPEELWNVCPNQDIFFGCVTVSNEKAKVLLGAETFGSVSKTEPYQKRLSFDPRG